MTYQTNVPNASQSPALFPSQANDNFSRLKTIITSNHKFNDSAAADDGYHQNVKMLPISTPGNDATVGQAFVNSSLASNELFFKDGLNNVWQITPCLPLRASVVFAPGNPGTISYSYNVSSVTRQGAGIYRINFSTAIPSASYFWSLNLIPSSSSNAIMVTVRTSTAPATSSFDLTARDSNGAANDSFVSVCALFYGG